MVSPRLPAEPAVRGEWNGCKDVLPKIRDTEATIPTPFTVVISLPTDDGGKKGVLVEVPRHLAAKMVVEGSAQLARRPNRGVSAGAGSGV
jgi:hypothetical protein